VHYVCHTGHSYSPESFLAASNDGIEAALWTAMSAMQEKAMVLAQLAEQAARAGDEPARRRLEASAAEVAQAADALRKHFIADPAGAGPVQ
jgi:two-component system, chemotaxis family, protein-glutamate methylesterase/glutaminase